MIANGSSLPVVIPAIVAHLVAAPGLPAVYDAGEVPQGAPYPYVVVQESTETREPEKMGRASKRFTVEAHVWTSTDAVAGSPQATGIASAVVKRMEYAALDLGGEWALIFVRAQETYDAGDDVEPGGPVRKHLVVVLEGEARPL